MAASTQAYLSFQVMSPEADRGAKGGEGSESNSVIQMKLRFPFNSPSTPYHFIANLSIAEIRLLLGSTHATYTQLFKWANNPSDRPEDAFMVAETTYDFVKLRTFLVSYPDTILSNLELI
jgi:hypothetical protein